MSNEIWNYYKLELKLKTPMMGPGSSIELFKAHVIEKAKKEIAKANKLGAKVAKSMEKFKGSEISEKKELLELQSLLRGYCQLLGKQVEIPETVEGVLELSQELSKELETVLENENSGARPTVFFRDTQGMPIISTHMILGNIKENVKIVVNQEDSKESKMFKSKVSVGEAGALDIKAVEFFMKPSNDILRGDDEFLKTFSDAGLYGKGNLIAEESGRIILERPIRFDVMGVSKTAIQRSEILPTGTEMSCTLRVRQGSKFTEELLTKIFHLGKNNGLGPWRGSGNMGSYFFKLTKIEDFKEEIPEGFL